MTCSKKFHDLSLLYIELSALSKLSSKRYQSTNQPASKPTSSSLNNVKKRPCLPNLPKSSRFDHVIHPSIEDTSSTSPENPFLSNIKEDFYDARCNYNVKKSVKLSPLLPFV